MRKRLLVAVFMALLLGLSIQFPSVMALDYDTDVLWYDELEDLSSWSKDAYFTLSLTNITFQQGDYAMNSTATGSAVNDPEWANLTIPSYSKPTNSCMGFWFYVDVSFGTGSPIKWYDDTGNWYVGINFDSANYKLITETPSAGIHNGASIGIALDTWYWFEVREKVGDYYLYANGTLKDSWLASDPVGIYDKFTLSQAAGGIWGNGVIFDMLRLANQLEFPPTYPPPPPPPTRESYYNIRYIFGLIGLAMIVIAPTYSIWDIKKNKNYMSIITAFVLAAIGYAFVVVWLVP